MNYDGPSFYKNSKIKTHKEIEKEAKSFIAAPPDNRKKRQESASEAKNKDYYFRSRRVPASLQNLDGWKKTESNQSLFLELEKRLLKRKDDYLLFEDNFQANEKQVKNQSSKKEKIEDAYQKRKNNIFKPSTGLHRSLSKIIAEDQDAIKNGKNSLESLFNDF